MTGRRSVSGRSRFAEQLQEATRHGWMPLTGDGVRPSGPLRDLPADDRLVLDAGAGRRVTLVRSPDDGVPLHELAALSVLQSGERRRVSLTDVRQESAGRRAESRAGRTVHRIVCQGRRHTVRVEGDGPSAPAHPGLDLAAEAVAAALGAPAPPCVQLLLDWPRRDVHLGERLEAARTLHRLAAWQERVPARGADVALASWLSPAELVGWEAVGLHLVDAVVWRWHGIAEPTDVRRWVELGCDPGQAQQVLETGVDLPSLDPWLAAGTPAPAAALLVRAGAEGPERLRRR